MTRGEVLRLKIEQQRENSGYNTLTQEQRVIEAKALNDAMRSIRESNKDINLMESYKEIRKGYRCE